MEECNENICSPVTYGTLTDSSRKFWTRELFVSLGKASRSKDSSYGKVIQNLCHIVQDDGGMLPERRHIRYANLPAEILHKILEFKIPHELSRQIMQALSE